MAKKHFPDLQKVIEHLPPGSVIGVNPIGELNVTYGDTLDNDIIDCGYNDEVIAERIKWAAINREHYVKRQSWLWRLKRWANDGT